MARKFDKRIHDLKTQNEDIRKFRAHSDAFIETQLNPVTPQIEYSTENWKPFIKEINAAYVSFLAIRVGTKGSISL